MATLDLPVLAGDVSLAEAITTLEQSGRSAVLMPNGPEWIVLDQAALTRRGNNRDMRLSAIAAATPKPLVVTADPAFSGDGGTAAAMAPHPSVRGLVSVQAEDRLTGAASMRVTVTSQDLVQRFSLALRSCVCPNGDVWAPGEPAVEGFCDFDSLKLTCK